MNYLLIIGLIILSSLGLAYVLNKRFEYTIPMVAASLVALLYVTGMFALRPIGEWLGITGMIGLIIWATIVRIRSGRRLGSLLWSPSLLFTIGISVVIAILSRNFVFSEWDEFSHWGLVLKNIYLSSGFGNGESSTTYFLSYPPGTSLFSSLFNQFNSVFMEKNALRGVLSLSFIQTLVLFSATTLRIKRDWKKIAIIAVLLITIPLIFFPSFYGTIYVDAVLGLITANMLCFHYAYRKLDGFYVIYMSLQAFMLVSAKQIGIGLALLILAVCAVDFIAHHYRTKKTSVTLSPTRWAIYLAIPFIIAITTNVSWRVFLSLHNITDQFTVKVGVSDVVNFIKGGGEAYRHTTLANFVQYVFTPHQYGAVNISLLMWLLAAAFTLYLALYYRAYKRDSRRLFYIGVILLAIIYIGFILFMYLFSFGSYEAIGLASIDRYMGTIFLAVVFVSVYVLIKSWAVVGDRASRLNTLRLMGIAIIVLTCINFQKPLNDTVFASSTDGQRIASRASTNVVERFRSLLDPKKDRIYIISQQSQGADYWVLRYTFTPVRISPPATWSLGKPYSADDIWTKDLSVDEWRQQLSGYTYVYIYRVDDRFRRDYGEIFDEPTTIKDDTLFKVDSSDGNLRLKGI